MPGEPKTNTKYRRKLSKNFMLKWYAYLQGIGSVNLSAKIRL